MDFRKFLSKPFKKLKGKLLRGSHRCDERSGNKDSRKGREVDDVGGREANQRNSYLYPGVSIEGAVESGPSREGTNVDGTKAILVDVDHPTSAPSILRIGEPDGM